MDNYTKKKPKKKISHANAMNNARDEFVSTRIIASTLIKERKVHSNKLIYCHIEFDTM